jgi:ubiquinone/menaquinone biosynthesis C-methylase UbiE
VVSDPLSVAREMRRVCRPGGRVVFLNHFRGDNAASGWLDDALDRLMMARARRPLEPGFSRANYGTVDRGRAQRRRRRR